MFDPIRFEDIIFGSTKIYRNFLINKDTDQYFVKEYEKISHVSNIDAGLKAVEFGKYWVVGIDESVAKQSKNDLIQVLSDCDNLEWFSSGISFDEIKEMLGSTYDAIRFIKLGEYLGLWGIYGLESFGFPKRLAEQYKRKEFIIIKGYQLVDGVCIENCREYEDTTCLCSMCTGEKATELQKCKTISGIVEDKDAKDQVILMFRNTGCFHVDDNNPLTGERIVIAGCPLHYENVEFLMNEINKDDVLKTDMITAAKERVSVKK